MIMGSTFISFFLDIIDITLMELPNFEKRFEFVLYIMCIRENRYFLPSLI